MSVTGFNKVMFYINRSKMDLEYGHEYDIYDPIIWFVAHSLFNIDYI